MYCKWTQGLSTPQNTNLIPRCLHACAPAPHPLSFELVAQEGKRGEGFSAQKLLEKTFARVKAKARLKAGPLHQTIRTVKTGRE